MRQLCERTFRPKRKRPERPSRRRATLWAALLVGVTATHAARADDGPTGSVRFNPFVGAAANAESGSISLTSGREVGDQKLLPIGAAVGLQPVHARTAGSIRINPLIGSTHQQRSRLRTEPIESLAPSAHRTPPKRFIPSARFIPAKPVTAGFAEGAAEFAEFAGGVVQTDHGTVAGEPDSAVVEAGPITFSLSDAPGQGGKSVATPKPTVQSKSAKPTKAKRAGDAVADRKPVEAAAILTEVPAGVADVLGPMMVEPVEAPSLVVPRQDSLHGSRPPAPITEGALQGDSGAEIPEPIAGDAGESKLSTDPAVSPTPSIPSPVPSQRQAPDEGSIKGKLLRGRVSVLPADPVKRLQQSKFRPPVAVTQMPAGITTSETNSTGSAAMPDLALAPEFSLDPEQKEMDTSVEIRPDVDQADASTSEVAVAQADDDRPHSILQAEPETETQADPTAELARTPKPLNLPPGTKLTPLYLGHAQVKSLTVAGDLRGVKIVDDSICQAFAAGNNQLKLVGTGRGTTQLVVWADTDDGGEAKMRAFEIHVDRVLAEEQNSSNLDVIDASITAAFPRCRVDLFDRGDSIVVTGRCDSRDKARKILRMVRKTCLVPVHSDLKISTR